MLQVPKQPALSSDSEIDGLLAEVEVPRSSNDEGNELGLIRQFLESTKVYDKPEEIKDGPDLTDDAIERRIKEKKEQILKKKEQDEKAKADVEAKLEAGKLKKDAEEEAKGDASSIPDEVDLIIGTLSP